MENCVILQQHQLRIFPKKHIDVGIPFWSLQRHRPMMKVKASAGRNNHCEFSTLNVPLEPRSHVGKFLSGVLQNHHGLFRVVATEELRQLSYDRDSAVSRMLLSNGSDEALLHRRIAKLKEDECWTAIQDVMYLLILYKFTEFGVPLVPKLSSCIYNRRLEVLPYKEWELESIHSLEVLDIIREHVTLVTRLRKDSSVVESWATTKIRKSWFARIYVASILYGYFLKEASLRYRLERSLSLSNHDLHIDHGTGLSFRGSKGAFFGDKSDIQSAWRGSSRQEEEIGDLKCYLNSFQPMLLLRCRQLRSKEAEHLVENHSQALFGSKEPDGDDVVLTSFSTLRRLILEAVAFGSFLWDTEDFIGNVYKLEDHEAK